MYKKTALIPLYISFEANWLKICVMLFFIWKLKSNISLSTDFCGRWICRPSLTSRALSRSESDKISRDNATENENAGISKYNSQWYQLNKEGSTTYNFEKHWISRWVLVTTLKKANYAETITLYTGILV